MDNSKITDTSIPEENITFAKLLREDKTVCVKDKEIHSANDTIQFDEEPASETVELKKRASKRRNGEKKHTHVTRNKLEYAGYPPKKSHQIEQTGEVLHKSNTVQTAKKKKAIEKFSKNFE